ncbi:Protein QmcA, partial [Symbiodinium microadriaticum]
MALAAIIPAAITLIAPDVSLQWQISIWCIATVCCAFFWVKFSRNKPKRYVEEPLIGEADQWVVERLGKYHTTLNPGLNILIPFLDNIAYRMSAKDQMIEVKGIEAITKDNAMTQVNAICFIRVADPKKAAYGVDNFNTAVRNLVMTTIRNAVGGMELDETLTNRDELAARLRQSMDVQMVDWGLSLRTVDIQDITPSDSMLKSMEKQAAAVRERKATEELAAGNKNAAIMEAQGKKEAMILDAEAKQQS